AAKPHRITIGISTSALFDMRESERIFQTRGVEKYQQHMIRNEAKPFAPGHAFALIETMRDINKQLGHDLFHVVLISKNDAWTGARAVKSCYHYDLPLNSGMFSNGGPTIDYLPAYNVDWFISTDKEDVEAAAKTGIAANVIDSPLYAGQALSMALKAKPATPVKTAANENTNSALSGTFNKKLHLVWDLDRVVFGAEADQFFTDNGLEKYLKHERENAHETISDGPFLQIAKLAGEITRNFPRDHGPIISSAITARSGAAALRAMLNLRAKGVVFNGAAHFIADGGERKARVLEVMNREKNNTILFLDDSAPTIGHTSKVVMSGLVPKTTPGLALGEKHPDAPKPK
ncbi:MAG: 5'-nucleotidase, partial [Alphaproteobacteria bacterium]|nr:5'-nucleotidase [Alphaproteobacteria bacterium]